MASPVLVVHVTTVPESLGFLKGQLRHLRERGFEFVAVSSEGDALERFGTIEQVPTRAVTMTRTISPLADLRALRSLVGLLRELRPTIVHAHTPKAGLLATLAAAIVGVPVRIYHLRGLPLLTASGWRRRVLALAERVATASATRVISVSRSLANIACEERLVSAEKLRVLANGSGQGVDTDRFDPRRVPTNARTVLRDRLGISSSAIAIGFLGRIVRDKGVPELLEAFQKIARNHPDVHLIVAGDREERDALSNTDLQLLQSHPRIHEIGFQTDTASLYAALDIVALPSHREGFPNVPLEAAAMQLPVVATRVSGCVDAVEDNVTGTLVTAGDSVALASALERYIVDAELRERHGLAARARVEKDFRREVIWDAIGDTYEELLVAAPRARYDLRRRLIDLVVAGTVLGVMAVPMAGVSLAIARTMGRPVIFAHERPGLGERTFRLFKFRTMSDARDESGELLPDSERITALGAWLRRTSLDELPELWNILKGDMTLVGPRPLLMRYLPYYAEHERVRHSVPPGITGWAQVHGRNEVSWDRRIALDVWYVRNRSTRLDLAILVRTLLMVMRREGVVVDPSSAMLDFDAERRARGSGAGHG